jgi:hypothetical protein
MIEDALRESLTSGMRTQVTVEPERLHDRQVGFDGEHRCARPLLFAENLTTTLVERAVDATDGIFRALDLDWPNVSSIRGPSKGVYIPR